MDVSAGRQSLVIRGETDGFGSFDKGFGTDNDDDVLFVTDDNEEA